MQSKLCILREYRNARGTGVGDYKLTSHAPFLNYSSIGKIQFIANNIYIIYAYLRSYV